MDLESLLAAGPAAGLRMVNGHLDGLDDEGRVLFRPDGAKESLPVAIGLEIPDGAVVKAARTGRRALVLAPPAGSGSSPVLVALPRERVAAAARDAVPGELQVRVDGETLVLRADQEIELRCGKSRLKLRKDGRVMLNGAHIVSASSGPNRIKGATIALN
jgi:hypothetical protein